MMLEKTVTARPPVILRKIGDLKLITEAPEKLRKKHQVRKAANTMNMEELIASIRHNGIIFELIVVEEKYVVAGNRRLTALRTIFENDPDFEVKTLDAEAFGGDPREIALATNVGLPMHPVDKFEILASLVADGHKPDDIASHYGMTQLQYDQVMKLAGLDKSVRDAWREGEITSGVAQAFTRSDDLAQQAKLLKQILKDGHANPNMVKHRLIPDKQREIGRFVTFITPEAYEEGGGAVNRDLFGDDHTVSNIGLLLKMTEDKLQEEVARLIADGWAWAIRTEGLQNRYSYSDMGKPYTAERKAKSGCFLTVDREGKLEIEFGKIKPGDERAARAAQKAAPAKGKKGAKETKAPVVVSMALGQRLALQLRASTQETLKIVGKSAGGLTEVLCKLTAQQLDGNFTVQQQAPDMRKCFPPKIFNEVLAKHFDAPDYFDSIPKGLLLSAIKDVGLFEQAKAIVKRSELSKFAIAHVGKSGWLPRELRTSHYIAPKAKAKK